MLGPSAALFPRRQDLIAIFKMRHHRLAGLARRSWCMRANSAAGCSDNRTAPDDHATWRNIDSCRKLAPLLSQRMAMIA